MPDSRQTDVDLTVAAVIQRYTDVLQTTATLDLVDVRQHVWVNELIQRYTDVLQTTAMSDLVDVRQHVWVNELSHFSVIGKHNFTRGDWT